MDVDISARYDYPCEDLNPTDIDYRTYFNITIHISSCCSDTSFELGWGTGAKVNWLALAAAARNGDYHREMLPRGKGDEDTISVEYDGAVFVMHDANIGRVFRATVPAAVCVPMFEEIHQRCMEFAADPNGTAAKY